MKKIIADTLGLELSELEEYRYQSTRNKRAIYCIGNDYFAVGQTAPKDELKWQPYKDQFFAKQKATTLWHATT